MLNPTDVALIVTAHPERVTVYCSVCRQWPAWSELVDRVRCPRCKCEIDEAQTIITGLVCLSDIEVKAAKLAAEEEGK